MKRTLTCVFVLAVLACRATHGDTWVVSRSVARVRNGPKPFCRTVTRVKKRTRIEVVGKDRRGRWLKASGIVVVAADGAKKVVVPFEAAREKGKIESAWIPKLAARQLRSETASAIELFTMKDVQAMQISVGAAIRGLDANVDQMIRDEKLDEGIAKWIASEKFSLEEYEKFHEARKPEETGKEVDVTGEDEMLELDPEVMEKIGRVAATQMAQEIGGRVVKDKTLNAYVNMVAALVGEFSSRYDLVYRVVIVRDARINSYSRPGGYIAVTTGLVELCENEAQLAAALAHEIAHISRDHGLKERKNVAKEIGIDIFGLESELEQAVKKEFGHDSKEFHSIAANQLNRMLNAFRAPAFSKKRHTDEEREADKYALAYLARAGYDPYSLRGLVQLFDRRGAADFETTMTCHDPPRKRIEHIDAGMRELGLIPQVQGRNEAPIKNRLNPVVEKWLSLGRPRTLEPQAKPREQAQNKPRDPFAELDAELRKAEARVD